MQFDVVLNQPDAGSLSLSLADVAAQDIAIGKLLEVNYRGGPIGSGGMYIENIQTDLVASGDKGGQWKKISGRGGLVLLEDAIVWSTTDTSRTFTAVTMGSILVTLINEAKARGCFPVMRVEFSATQDSSGALWTDSTTITLQTGTSLLDVARQFSELGIDFKLIFDWPRNDFALYAYQSSFGIDRSSSVVLRPGLNCEELGDDQESSALKNAYLVPYQVGITSTKNDASIATYRRRETMFQASNAPSSGSALVLANAEMNAVKDPKRSIRIKVNDAGGPMAGVDYDIGDWVGVDWQDGNVPAKYRIRGTSYSWDAGQKYASITLTLNSLKIEQEIRSAIALKKIANGSLGSSVSGAAPDAGTAVDAHDADANAHVNRPLAGDLSGTLGAPVVAKLRGVTLKNPLNISDGQVLAYNAANAQIEPKTGNDHTHTESQITDLSHNAVKIQGTDVDSTAPGNGQMLVFDSAARKYKPSTPSGSGDVIGPSSAVDGHPAVFDGNTGKLIRDGGAPAGVGNVSLRASSSNYGSNSPASVTIPAGAQVGDLLIIFIGSNNASTGTPPTGWVILGYTSGTYHNVAVLAKSCASGDPGSTVSIPLTGNEVWECVCAAVSGAVSFSGIGTNRAASGTSLDTTLALFARSGQFCLYFGSARVGSKTCTFSSGTEILTRASDASLSATLWSDSAAMPAHAVFSSPSATSGIAAAIVTFAG